MENKRVKKAIGFEGVLCIVFFLVFFYVVGSKMGVVNMFNTLMNTGHYLLLNVVFYILAIAVITGAIAGILSEFGVIAIINKLLSPLMKPLYDLPGAATLGIALLPLLGEKLSFILKPLFGFSSPAAIAFPITSLGAVGAAISLVPNFLEKGLISGNDIAVFTAMGMCWSGYLSTHVAMMDALDCRKLTGNAILSHTIGGLCAGISAPLIFIALL